MIEFLSLLMFAALAVFLFSGFPVAFILGGLGLAFWLLAVLLGLENPLSFFLVVGRIFGGVVNNLVLVAIPMFIFMGTILEKSGIAHDLLATLGILTRRIPGGLALSVTLIGVIMAATTGIIGASVVMMTLLALPVMMDRGYDKALSSGTIAASGTLGILLPPSIMLVVMADLLSISVGNLFMAAVIPGLMLSVFYIIYIMIRTSISPQLAPPLPLSEGPDNPAALLFLVFKSFLPPVILIALVLGSIFGGIATPTEASGLGAAGALCLALVKRKLSWANLKSAVDQSTLTTAMLFGIFVGATAFSYVFALLGGHDMIVDLVASTGAGPWGLLLILMGMVFVLGFFFDWIEITLIVLPVFAPVIATLDFSTHIPWPEMTVIWFAILMAVNLQTSFLTPPFGFALFYIKGSAPKEVKIQHIYKGIIPFIALQLVSLLIIVIWPEIVLWLPARME